MSNNFVPGCGCNNFSNSGSGGLKIGGIGSIVTSTPFPGVSIGSPGAIITSNIPGDGHTAIWLLDQQYNGTAGEVIDVTGHVPIMDGTGGAGIEDNCFSLTTGMRCLPAQQGTTGTQFIQCPADDIPETQGFAVSFWLKLADGLENFLTFQGKPLFSRGPGFQIETSILNHLYVRATGLDASGEQTQYLCFSSPLNADEMYHVAASWSLQDGIRIFLNGIQVKQMDAPLVALDGLGAVSIGRLREGRGLICQSLQDVRLHPETRDESWWQMEHANYCDGEFFTVADWE